MNVVEMLSLLNTLHGPSGDEGEVCEKIKELVTPYVDECTIDTLGNLIARKKGTGPKVMFSAHMDSIGMIVTNIGKDGMLHVAQIGGLRPTRLLETPLRFKNGRYATVSSDTEIASPQVVDLLVDIGAKDEEDAKSIVKVGDIAVYATPTLEAGDRIISPYHDDRIACVILIKALEQLGKSNNDLYFVFSVQEELGLRGAKTAAYGVDPDYGIAVDVTIASDIPNKKKIGTTKLGGGAAIKIMDASVICHPKMVALMESIAAEKGIANQRDILSAGGTDAGAIHLTRSGVISGGISIPTRYIHSPTEMVDKNDIQACIDLVVAFSEADLPQV